MPQHIFDANEEPFATACQFQEILLKIRDPLKGFAQLFLEIIFVADNELQNKAENQQQQK